MFKENKKRSQVHNHGHKDHKKHSMDDGHDHSHDEINFDEQEATLGFKDFLPGIISFIIMITGIVMDQLEISFFQGFLRFSWYLVAYLYVGLSVIIKAYKSILKGEVFNEFFLMSIATIGAFAIGEYSEGVAVMLFYFVGELFQEAAANKAKSSIQALLDIRSDETTVIRNGEAIVVDPKEVETDEIIRIKVGEKVSLDGVLLSKEAAFDTAALTGESKPDTKRTGESVLAGMINLNTVCEVRVTAAYADTKLSQILTMIQDATAKKSKTQLFITRFAKIYTPIVVLLATILTFAPALFVENYVFQDWLYRGLVFLVISCPCALVISVPLGYFGGIGLASRNGILFKGSNYLDVMTEIDTVVMDKTGTLTKGVFTVQEVNPKNYSQEELLVFAASLEEHSTHPIATAITAYVKKLYPNNSFEAKEIEEIAGHGLKGTIDGKTILAGNAKLLDKFGITYPDEVKDIVESIVLVGINQTYAGYITVADEIKDDSKEAIEQLHAMGIKTVMLSGDKTSIVDKVAKELNIDTAFGNLLPDDKVRHVEELKKQGRKIAFTGDGINDAPVLALSDAGLAMGGLGSDAAIETADIVIQNDQPSRIPLAIRISKKTRKVVIQNITLAIGVKVIVLALGALGEANLWAAIFADVGVSLIAILNSVRIQFSRIK
ncbi:heavy metal translocating P-type ATPase [Myroides guanonis]|uniref:P-type Zn(2+) transporter n=1 Tax=Myroides guanonis TaxID=1150112 RepID=A0A1I3NCB7_9FLAO|nr:heavy metal translocating P-type ATPase [Myroides guanonis]SFJ06707.1 Cd2+/Zn2+-exporting ATPase [Myroides guanonis]